MAMSILDRLEALDPAYRRAYTWCCPNNCGTELAEQEGGLYCRACRQPFSYAELAGTDD